MRIFLILFLIYMVYRTMVKYVFPEMLRTMVNNAAEEAQRNMQQQQKQTNNPPHRKDERTLNGGDYVDYEEVK